MCSLRSRIAPVRLYITTLATKPCKAQGCSFTVHSFWTARLGTSCSSPCAHTDFGGAALPESMALVTLHLQAAKKTKTLLLGVERGETALPVLPAQPQAWETYSATSALACMFGTEFKAYKNVLFVVI